MIKTSRAALITGAALLGCMGAAIGFGLWIAMEPRSVAEIQPVEAEQPVSSGLAPQGAPTLYCGFYNFTHTGTVVSFYFGVEDTDTPHPRFSEIYVEEAGAAREIFDEANGPRPAWSFAVDDGTPTITSPDAETKIILYGLKLEPGVFLMEAGVRSNDYKNLEGQCRQAHFASSIAKPNL